MLGTILSVIRAARRPLCASELAARLDLDQAALEGMLHTLVHRGRLRAIEPGADGCGGCPIRSGCYILRDDRATTYVLSETPQGDEVLTDGPPRLLRMAGTAGGSL